MKVINWSNLIGLMVGALVVVQPLTAEETVLAKGNWVKKSQRISGTWQIVDTGESREFRLLNFRTEKAARPSGLFDGDAKYYGLAFGVVTN